MTLDYVVLRPRNGKSQKSYHQREHQQNQRHLHHTQRLSLLIDGFIRRCRGTYDVDFIPSDIVKIVIDMYYYWAIHNEWLGQNIIIQILNPDSNQGKPVYFSGSLNESLCMSFNITHDCNFKFPSVAADAYNYPTYYRTTFFSPIWRMYFDEDSEGFMIRPADIASPENLSEWTNYLKLPRTFGQREKSIIFRLVPTQRVHEYYIQRLEDGHYLSIKYGPDVRYILYPDFAARNGHTRDIRLESFGFKESSSAATLFRFRANRHPLDQWRKQLRVGDSVLYRKHGRDWIWVNGKVIATKYNGFGTEIKVKYKGIIGGGHWDDCDLFTTPTSCHHNYGKVQRVQGEIWLPVESNLISIQNHNGIYHTVMREEHYNWFDFLPESEWEVIEGLYGEIGDRRIGRQVPEGTHDLEYEKRRKSKKRRKGKKRKCNDRNWKSNDKLRKKAIERKSRKYGLIPKYELYL